MKRHSYALRPDEVAQLVARSGREPATDSPLVPFLDKGLPSSGALTEPWVEIVGVLADPDRCARVLVCSPTARLNVVAYRRDRSAWVGFFPQADSMVIEAGLGSAALGRAAASWFPATARVEASIPDLTGRGVAALLPLADVARRRGSDVVPAPDAAALLADPPLSTLTGRVIDLAPARCAPRPDRFDAGLRELERAHLTAPLRDGVALAPALGRLARAADPDHVALVQVKGHDGSGPLAGHVVVFGGETTWRLRFEGILDDRCQASLESVSGGELLSGLYTLLDDECRPTPDRPRSPGRRHAGS